MRNTLKIELKKAIHNKYFLITFTIAIFIALWSSVHTFQYMNRIQQYLLLIGNNKNPNHSADSLYNNWMGGQFGSFPTDLYYFILPLIAAFPYGWSYFQERKNGYSKNVICRCGRKNYVLSKYICTFIIGGITVLLPLIMNYIIVACFVPARMPDPCCNIHYAVFGDCMWSNLFYTNPLLYDVCYMILTFVFGGLWATISMMASYFLKNKFAVLLVPYILLIIFHYGIHSLFAWKIYLEASPINYIRGVMVDNISKGWLILLELFILFIFGFGITLYKGIKDDVY